MSKLSAHIQSMSINHWFMPIARLLCRIIPPLLPVKHLSNDALILWHMEEITEARKHPHNVYEYLDVVGCLYLADFFNYNAHPYWIEASRFIFLSSRTITLSPRHIDVWLFSQLIRRRSFKYHLIKTFIWTIHHSE